MRKPRKYIIGKSFGFMTIIDLAGDRSVVAQCVCGKTRVIATNNFLRNSPCGCYWNPDTRIKSEKHGMTRTPEYRAWSAMNSRCYNKKSGPYADYGGRGIYVEESWRNSFSAFLADMGKRPSPGHSLDRINVNGPYSKENCRWATITQQNRNMRNSVRIFFEGTSVGLYELVEITGMKRHIIRGRIDLGWPLERIISTAPAKHGVKTKRIMGPNRRYYKKDHSEHLSEVLTRLYGQKAVALANNDTKTAYLIERIIRLLEKKK